MLYIPATIYENIADTLLKDALITAPEYKKQHRYPVGFSVLLTEELIELEADIGARPVIEKHRSQLRLIEAPCDGTLHDIDYLSSLVY